MSLIDGLILHTLDKSKTVSQHSLLMEFYALDKQIDDIETKRLDDYLENKIDKKTYKGFELTLYFLRIEAYTLLRVLNIK